MRRKPLILAIAAVSVGTVAGVAYAASVPLTESKLDTGSAAVTPACGVNGPGINTVYTHYSAANGYRIDNVDINGNESDCQLRPYELTEADNGTGYAQLGEWTGTLPGSMTAVLSPASVTSAGNVNSVNPTNNQVQVFLVTKTS